MVVSGGEASKLLLKGKPWIFISLETGKVRVEAWGGGVNKMVPANPIEPGSDGTFNSLSLETLRLDHFSPPWVRTWVLRLSQGQEWNSKGREREEGQINERTEMVFQKTSVGCPPNNQHCSWLKTVLAVLWAMASFPSKITQVAFLGVIL